MKINFNIKKIHEYSLFVAHLELVGTVHFILQVNRSHFSPLPSTILKFSCQLSEARKNNNKIKYGRGRNTLVRKYTECPTRTVPGISLIIQILSGRKWWPHPAHVMMSSHFLHNEVSPLQISLQYPH